MAIDFHYCSGHLTKISVLNFVGSHDRDCGCNTKDMPKDCCKDKLLVFKTDNHKIVPIASIPEFISFAIELPSSNFQLTFYGRGHVSDVNIKDVQRSYSQPIYLQIGVFRI